MTRSCGVCVQMGRTPLHVACRLNDVDLARAILKSKDVNMNAQMEVS